MKILGAEVNMISMWDVLQALLGRSAKVSTSEGKQDTGLKANFMGFGKNDETLFWEAVALAELKKLMKRPEGRQNLSAILAKLEYWEKRHFYQMIGKDSQSIVIESHTESTGSASATQTPLMGRRRSKTADPIASPETKDGDGAKIEKTTLNGNIRGAMIVAFFASMEPVDAIALLKNSGTLKGVPDDIGELYKQFSAFVGGKVEVKQYLTKIGVTANEAALWFLGATDLADAERKVAEREQDVARLREKTWYERDLKKRPVFTKTLLGLIVFIVLGTVYVFIIPH